MQEQCGDLHFQTTYLLAMQEMAEAHAVNLFKDANLYTVHAKWVTVMHKDIKLA